MLTTTLQALAMSALVTSSYSQSKQQLRCSRSWSQNCFKAGGRVYMTNLRRRVVCFLACSAAFLMCSLMFAGAAYADSTPSDPIIDMEGINSCIDCATVQFASATTGSDFATSFQFPTTNCTSDGVMSCNSNFTFTNEGPAIANMEFTINTFNSQGTEVDINQQGFQAPSPDVRPAAYQVVFQDPNGISAIYAAPTGFEIATGQSFFVDFTRVLIPNGGTAVVHMQANVPVSTPEPGEVALLGVSLPGVALLFRRRRL